MMLRGLISFIVLMIVTEGSSVKVHLGGNTTLPCSIKDDREITWIITNGNQTFVRILKLEYGYGPESKPEPSNIHPSYAGRIRALSSSTNTHSLLLMNITDTDLMLYCCMDYKNEQTHCTKLDYEENLKESKTLCKSTQDEQLKRKTKGRPVELLSCLVCGEG
ncbi:uncharacterized protein LOC131533349 isoform X4 [Onychostoma macrolepis]|uniref:uncharacterized protein LOC131533349 isoform X4 n=1 Tax=Onychostoma macrolepis TaxID=369639 RepID=UPI00272A2B7F|nr:uncharacterized protein LOC131533349 isoform X4 [Onychostoma macrolepis]